MENTGNTPHTPTATYIRRGIAVLLGVVFLLSLLVSLALIRLNTTLLDPEFYPDLVKKNHVYRFTTVDALATAIDEARRVDAGQFGGIFRENPIAASGLTTRQLAEAVHRGLSVEYIERLGSSAMLQVGAYVTGNRDSVAVSADTDHVRGVTGELHELMSESGAYALLIEHELEPRVREAAGEMLSANENMSVWVLYLFESSGDAEDRMVQVVMSTLTAEWLADQVELALEEFTAYLVGETDSFEIRISLTDSQIENAVEETKSILLEVDAYELVYPGVIEPVLTSVVGAGVELPYGVSVSTDEVMGALRQAAPPSWVQREAEYLIDSVGPYVVGRSDGFSTEIDLSLNKREAATALEDLVVGNVHGMLSTLPFCGTRAESTVARRRLEHALPGCIPSGVSVDQILGHAEDSIADSVHTVVLASIPDTVRFDEERLRAALERSGGPQTLERLDYIRSVMDEGWTYSDQDLRTDLSARDDALHALDRVRVFFRDGYSHKYRPSSSRPSINRVGAALDGVRARLDTVSSYEWLAYLLTPVLLVFTSLLGGSSWRSRVIWASSTVLISAGLIYILTWPIQQLVADAAAEQARAEVGLQMGGIFSGTMHLIDAKVGEIAEGVAVDILSGLRLYSLLLAGAAAVVLLTALFWRRLSENLLRRSRSTVYGP
ncbi:MAG: hypothetical protein J4G14_05355 [Dehalococcoidia bacterium]|nr:hypothetical protein [Dehalococcoidia bacterium]